MVGILQTHALLWMAKANTIALPPCHGAGSWPQAEARLSPEHCGRWRAGSSAYTGHKSELGIHL